MADTLDDTAVADRLRGLPAWDRDGDAIRRQVKAPSFPAGIDVVTDVARAAEDAGHHPDIDIRWRTLTFTLSTHSVAASPARTSTSPPRSTRSPPGTAPSRPGVAVQVAVCGPGECTGAEWDLAYETGRLLAGRGAVVLCGGLGGVMAAAAAGARAAAGSPSGAARRRPRRRRARPHHRRPDGARAGPQQRPGQRRRRAHRRRRVLGTLSEIALAMRAGRIPVVQVGGWRVLDEEGHPAAASCTPRTRPQR